MVFGIKGCATAHSIAHKSRQKNVEHAKKMSMSWHNANGKSISYKNFVFILCKKLLLQTMAFRAAKNGKKAEKSFRWCVFCFRVRLLTHITLEISFHANIFSFFFYIHRHILFCHHIRNPSISVAMPIKYIFAIYFSFS